jgi:hypothetical protein
MPLWKSVSHTTLASPLQRTLVVELLRLLLFIDMNDMENSWSAIDCVSSCLQSQVQNFVFRFLFFFFGIELCCLASVFDSFIFYSTTQAWVSAPSDWLSLTQQMLRFTVQFVSQLFGRLSEQLNASMSIRLTSLRT